MAGEAPLVPQPSSDIPRELARASLVSGKPSEAAPQTLLAEETRRRDMMIRRELVLAGCMVFALSVGAAQAGPCDGKSAQDAGAGPTPGHTGQTIGSTGSAGAEHPPAKTMDRATGDVAASSQDAQRQMQGQPTAAQQSQGAQPSEKMPDRGC
jgi:hypothetical protein